MQNKLLDTKELSVYLGIAVSTILGCRIQEKVLWARWLGTVNSK